MVDRTEVFQALRQVMDPEMQKDIVSLNFIQDVEIDGENVKVTFQPDTTDCPILDVLVWDIKGTLSKLSGVKQIDVNIDSNGSVSSVGLGNTLEGDIRHLNKISKVISVMSGKCRARKCMVSSLLAISLRRAGYQVGLLDTDISDRHICKMFFSQKPSPQFTPRAMLPVITSTGIKMMALSVHLPQDETDLNYHNPVVVQTVRELTSRVFWGNLDYLIVDMPSGSSELPREILKSYAENGVILVTTPHDQDGKVIKKVAQDVQEAGVRVLGIIENQSNFDRDIDEFADVVMTPGHFGNTAKALNVPELGRINIDPSIAVLCDQGKIENCKVPDFEKITEWVLKQV